MEIFLFLLAPFVASLILTGIHAYLGVHVVERGVIFVDLALAQIAALGATIAFSWAWMRTAAAPTGSAWLHFPGGGHFRLGAHRAAISRRKPSSASPTPWPRRRPSWP